MSLPELEELLVWLDLSIWNQNNNDAALFGCIFTLGSLSLSLSLGGAASETGDPDNHF